MKAPVMSRHGHHVLFTFVLVAMSIAVPSYRTAVEPIEVVDRAVAPALRERAQGVILESPGFLTPEARGSGFTWASLRALANVVGLLLAVLAGIAIGRRLRPRRRVSVGVNRERDSDEAAGHQMGGLLAGLSHEMRPPMNGILAMTGRVLDLDLPAEARSHLETVRASAAALLGVIDDVADFSKIETGELALDRIGFSLRQCLGEALKEVAVQAHKGGLELGLRVHPEVPDAFVGDAGRLRQIVRQLATNGIKSTAEGEVIVHVDLRSEDDATAEIEFGVADTGVGIPAAMRSTIFRAFGEPDDSPAHRYGGTGLGLAICARLVGMMGGSIWVESNGERGSIFRFTLRLGLQAGRAASVEASQAALRGVRALIVDDSPASRCILEEMLAGWGMKPASAPSGEAALAVLQDARMAGTPFDLVLADARMPGMDGFRLVEGITRSPALADKTIMLLAPDGGAPDIARCREAGVAAWVTKPVAHAELLAAVMLALGRTPQPHTPRQRSVRSLAQAPDQLDLRVYPELPEDRLQVVADRV